MLVEAPIALLPSRGPLAAQLLAKVLTHERVRIELSRLERVFPR
jgi:hypothetical protein